MKLMSLTAEPKVSWLSLQAILEKLNQKLENRLIKKLPNGEKKAELKLFQEFSLSMRCTCWILNVSLSSTELWKVIKHQLSLWPPTEVLLKSEELII